MAIKRNDSCCKLDEPQKYSAKFKKPVTKDHMWCGFISMKCDWLCVLAGWSMLPVSVTSITPRGWWGRASACSWIRSSAQPSNPTSQASPKSRGAPGSRPHRSLPRPLGSSPRLLPHLLPLRSTPGGGPGEAAGTLLFASLFLLSLFFLIDIFFREVLVSQQNEAKNTVFPIYPTDAQPPLLSKSCPREVHLLQEMNLHRHRVITQSLCWGHSWCCTFCGFRHMHNDTYPSLDYHTEYFHCPIIPSCSACSSLPPLSPLAKIDLSTVS